METPARSDRLPPQNLVAEKGLLGSILLDNSVFDEVSDRLLPDHFYLDSHRKIYAAIKSLHDRGKHAFDAVTVTISSRFSRAPRTPPTRNTTPRLSARNLSSGG
jgi:replicative DNA helicase